MTWIARSLPPEPDLPPPDPPRHGAAVPSPARRVGAADGIEALAAERHALLDQVRPRVRSSRQERIRRRIAEITRLLLIKGNIR